ncbi:MAG: hypothetical protein DRN27_06085 [Thermoplasmata archaeon]|nr:MAG: hypothetical protein DRN27_06085 [Thermoplasmata archaeon]
MKKIFILSIFGMILIASFATALQGNTLSKINEITEIKSQLNDYIDITPNEAWEMMNSTEDGIQIPIDVRRLDEYIEERIILPDEGDWIRWFPYELKSGGSGPIKNEDLLLQMFMKIYDGKEIIIYCRTGRRTGISAQILIDNGFTGTVYNMLGGITEWKSVGLPTTQN